MYIVYWIPYRTPTFNPKKYNKKFLHRINIDDINVWEVDLLFSEHLGKHGKIFIDESDSGRNLITLEVVYYDNFGFMVCKILYIEPQYENLLKEALLSTLYHIIKEFWHNHEFHPLEEDTKLRAFRVNGFNENRIEVFRRIFLNHYIRLYEDKFIKYDKQYSEHHKSMSALTFLKGFVESFSISKFFNLLKDEENLSLYWGEYLYFKTLRQAFSYYKRELAPQDRKILSSAVKTIDNIAEFLKSKRDGVLHKKGLIVDIWTLIGVLLAVYPPLRELIIAGIFAINSVDLFMFIAFIVDKIIKPWVLNKTQIKNNKWTKLSKNS